MGFKQMHVPPIPKGISAATTVPEFAKHYANIKMSRRKTVIVLQHNGRFKVRSSGEVDKKVHCKCIQQHLFYDYYHNIQQHFGMSCLKGIPMLYHENFKCKTYLSVILVRLQIYGISLPHSPFFPVSFLKRCKETVTGALHVRYVKQGFIVACETQTLPHLWYYPWILGAPD